MSSKSTLLFAKAVILVEGIAEALLLPVLARIALRERNEVKFGKDAAGKQENVIAQDSLLPKSLEDAGIAVINMSGIYFRHFMQLFCRLDGEDALRLPMRCAGLTDQDPPHTKDGDEGKEIEIKPIPNDKAVGKNPALALIAPLEKTKNTRLFANELKSFEYDLAMTGANMSLMLEIASELYKNNEHPCIARELEVKSREDWKSDKDWKRRADAAAELHRRVADYKGEFAQMLAERLAVPDAPAFAVPPYIKKAVAWVMAYSDEM